jgi:hypothetical protein
VAGRVGDCRAGTAPAGSGSLDAEEKWQYPKGDPAPARLVALVRLLRAGRGYLQVWKVWEPRFYLFPVLISCIDPS